MRALILSAGQGSRLLPLTKDRPKCMLSVGPRTVIEWQVRQLAAGGVDEIVVVLGFQAALVEAHLATLAGPSLKIRTIFNPFFNVADNLGSCWLARGEMDRDFIILNGDTLFEPAVLARLLASPPAPITVTIDRKPEYDADDMKVRTEGTGLREIGKTLPLDRVNGESIGMLLFRGAGPRLFAEAVDRTMHTPDGLKWWYLKVIDILAREGTVETASIEGLQWGEIDFHEDLQQAERMVRTW
ncbi:MAG: phosphocholine cytidylyltransferase family protein [Dongiaceae bacterium]